MADAQPIVIQQPAQPPVVAVAQSAFSQILIGAVAGVAAWWLIEMLRQEAYEEDELANDYRARAVYGDRRRRRAK